jgi:hypothetical protein
MRKIRVLFKDDILFGKLACVLVIYECALFCTVNKKSFENITSYKYLAITVTNQSYIHD